MDQLNKLSKDDLVYTCEKLQKKLKKYESRLSALVEAYKNLIEDKKMLEGTIETLSKANTARKPPTSPSNAMLPSTDDPLGALSPDTPDTNPDERAVTSAESIETVDIKSFEDKITDLSKALQSMNEAKSKNENIYQNDKKMMLSKHKKEYALLMKEKEDIVKSEQEIKSKLRQQQQEREDEQILHGSMLKELQLLVECERLEKEELQSQLSDKVSKEETNKYELQINDLTKQLEQVKTRLEKAEHRDGEPEKQIEYLTEQVEYIKSQHSHALIVEQKKSCEAEQLLKSRQIQEEKRVAELESRLTDLSTIVGNYDKQRESDQLVIQELREKLRIDVTNTTLHTNALKERVHDEDSGQVSELYEQVFKLKSLLKVSWRKTDRNLQRMSSSEIDELLSNDPAHHSCQEEYKQLRNEYELYKRKNVLQKHSDKDALSEDVINYKKKIETLESLMTEQQKKFDATEKYQLEIITSLQSEMTRAKELQDLKIEDVKNEYKKYLEQADGEIKKQRGRMLLLINEKELEIEHLKEKLFQNEDTMISVHSLIKQKSFTENETKSVADELLLSSPTASSSNNSFFHFNQQVSHLEIELSSARGQILDLEGAVRDAEHREEQVLKQMQFLKEDIRRLERSRSRESANLEYLKNVCLQFILSDSYSVKSQMLSAISTILTFSPQEMAQIELKRQSWWN